MWNVQNILTLLMLIQINGDYMLRNMHGYNQLFINWNVDVFMSMKIKYVTSSIIALWFQSKKKSY